MKKNHPIQKMRNVALDEGSSQLKGKNFLSFSPKRVQRTRDKKSGEFSFVELDDCAEPHWKRGRIQHERNFTNMNYWFVCL